MVWGEYEMVDFAYASEEISQPLIDVSITPYAFQAPESLSLTWGEMVVIDSALYGSILNQRWKMYVWGPMDTAFLHFGVSHQQKRVLADGYFDSGFNSQPDGEGVMRLVPFDSLSGITITVRASDEIRYSANTHIPQLTLTELWTGETLWPRKRGGREVDLADKILILGGRENWDRLRRSNTPALVGSLIRLGPIAIWKRALYATLTSGMGEEGIQEELGGIQRPEATSRK